MPTTLKRDNLLSFANSHREEYETLLRQFVETPTVSVDPNHLDERNAEVAGRRVQPAQPS